LEYFVELLNDETEINVLINTLKALDKVLSSFGNIFTANGDNFAL
jgi:hypothetical protein